MQDTPFSSPYADRQHARLVKTFLLLSLLGAVAILLLVSFGLYEIIDRHIIRD